MHFSSLPCKLHTWHVLRLWRRWPPDREDSCE
jgi:hypothetical protein